MGYFTKYLGNDIKLSSLKLISSGIVNFSELFPSIDIEAKVNKFNKDSLNVTLELRNNSSTVFSQVNLILDDYLNITEKQVENILEKQLFEIYNLDACTNLINKYNDSFKEETRKLLKIKLNNLEKCLKETINQDEKKQLEFLIKFYSEIKF